MISSAPFQPQPFCDPMILWQRLVGSFPAPATPVLLSYVHLVLVPCKANRATPSHAEAVSLQHGTAFQRCRKCGWVEGQGQQAMEITLLGFLCSDPSHTHRFQAHSVEEREATWQHDCLMALAWCKIPGDWIWSPFVWVISRSEFKEILSCHTGLEALNTVLPTYFQKLT